MKRDNIQHRVVLWGLGLALGAGLMSGPSTPCFAALSTAEKILKAESDLDFYGHKRDFFNQLASKADSEFNSANDFKQNVWNPLKTIWLQYVTHLKKTQGATAKPIPFLEFLFIDAQMTNRRARKFHDVYFKDAPVDEDGPDLTNLKELRAYLTRAQQFRAMGTTQAAIFDDKWNKTKNYLDGLKANLTAPADPSNPTAPPSGPDTTDPAPDPESPTSSSP